MSRLRAATSAALGSVVLAAAAGCAGPAPAPLPVVATATQPRNTAVTTPEAPAAVTATTAPTTTAPPPPTTARGNTTLALGQGAVGRTGDRDAGWTLTVDDVTVGAPCPDVPTRGQLLVARVRLDTTPDYDTAQPAPPVLADLTVVAPDGTPTGDLDTSPARACDPGTERAPAGVRAAASYTFAVVLDSPVTAGILALHPPSQPTGWEWPFPRG